MPHVTTIQDVIKEAKTYLPHLDEGRILKAYEFAKKAHEGQVRLSGEPYIHHPLESTRILLSLRPDEDSIVACLLHDVLEDTEVKAEAIEAAFGTSIMPLILGMEKLGKVQYRGEERQIENLRKMFLAMAKDIRVVLIKLADRLHNMQTLEYVRPDKRKRIAEETLMIYVPIATRLGIYTLKNELENLCFKILHPNEYEQVEGELKQLLEIQEAIIKTCKRHLTHVLNEEKIESRIEGRIKHAYSIYKKLRRKNKNYVNELYDVVALRVIVKDEAECYRVLGILHRHWTPLPGRFKDYVGHHKPNGYQSLHTTLVGLCPKVTSQPVEVQIRTATMDRMAQFGIAAHWQYKEVGGKSITVPDDKLQWIQSLVGFHETLQSNEEFVESLNIDFFKDRIFALTPQGDIRDLPVNATPVDFAYAIHTEVGHRCQGARVNGQIVPLNYQLKNGQVVEILTSNISNPNRYWLSFVVTTSAKSRIKQWFNTQNRDEVIQAGKELITAQLRRFNLPLLDSHLLLFKVYGGRKLTFKERETLVEKIGNGTVNVVTALNKVIPEEKMVRRATQKEMADHILPENVELDRSKEILITGQKGFKTQIATCCMPGFKDEIVGYITRGRGVTIHRKQCKVVQGNEKERLIKANWKSKQVSEFLVKLCLERKSRIGLLRDIADVFAMNNLSIIDFQNIREERSDIGKTTVTVSVADLGMLNTLMDQLENVPGIIRVYEGE